MLTVERLKALLEYEPETGAFRWKSPTNQRIRRGIATGRVGTKGYLYIGIDRKSYMAHRLAWLYVHGHWPLEQIDHINRIKTDNRIANLRDVPDAINKLNMDRSAVLRDGQGRFAAV